MQVRRVQTAKGIMAAAKLVLPAMNNRIFSQKVGRQDDFDEEKSRLQSVDPKFFHLTVVFRPQQTVRSCFY